MPDEVDANTTATLQARAIERACRPCPPKPVCIHDDDPAELVAALEERFPEGVAESCLASCGSFRR